MTELEKMQRAKMYMEKLANGIDPITDSEIEDDAVLNNVYLARSFFYVSEILGKVIANGGVVKSGKNKPKFFITQEELAKVQLSDTPIAISELCEHILATTCDETRGRLQVTKVTGWLVKKGFLQVVTSADGKHRKIPTDFALELGITVEHRSSPRGVYDVNLYSKQAQQFILDNLTAILQEDI